MNEKLNYRLTTCVIHFVVYLVIILVPWLFVFEMLPLEYGAITVFAEVSLYILWGIVLFLSTKQIKRDIKDLTFETMDETVSKRMWRLSFTILRIFMLLTLAFLILALVMIGISFMV